MPPPPHRPDDGDRSFHVRPTNDGATLAAALRKMLGEQTTSWGEVRRLVSARHIHLNGNLVLDEARRVKAGDVVHVFAHSRAPLPTESDIAIRFMDDHLVVIEKPAGLNTLRHREETDLPQKRKDKAPTLDELLQRLVTDRWYASRPAAAKTDRRPTAPPPRQGKGAPPPHPLFGHRGPAKTPQRPGTPPRPAASVPTPISPPRTTPPELRPVHRLDRETSGLMLFALSPQAEQILERDFARHAVERKYLAVVHGHFADPRTIETHLVRDRGDGLRGSSPKGSSAPEAQRALTRVTPLERIGYAPDAYTLIECQLETGRTHQIRIHLSELGHPLAGEKTYTHRPPPDGSPYAPPGTLPPPPRHALHSATLRFTHPITGQPLEFKSDFPRELATWLRKLRAAAAAAS